jgi:hypothetical protein
MKIIKIVSTPKATAAPIQTAPNDLPATKHIAKENEAHAAQTIQAISQ